MCTYSRYIAEQDVHMSEKVKPVDCILQKHKTKPNEKLEEDGRGKQEAKNFGTSLRVLLPLLTLLAAAAAAAAVTAARAVLSITPAPLFFSCPALNQVFQGEGEDGCEYNNNNKNNKNSDPLYPLRPKGRCPDIDIKREREKERKRERTLSSRGSFVAAQ